MNPFILGKEKPDYIFDIIKDNDPVCQYDTITWARERYNKNLKKLAEMAGIEENVTSYAARHTFASGADDMGSFSKVVCNPKIKRPPIPWKP